MADPSAPSGSPMAPPPGYVLGVDSGGSGLRIAVARTDGSGGVGTDAGEVPRTDAATGIRKGVRRGHPGAGTASRHGASSVGRPSAKNTDAPADTVRPLASYVFSEPVRTGPDGIDARHLLRRVLPVAQKLLCEVGGRRYAAVCVGAAGMVALGADLRAHLPAAVADTLGTRRLALAADAVTAYVGALGQRPGAVVALGTGMVALGTDLTASGGWRRADGWGHLLGDCGSGAWIGRAGLEAALRAHDGRTGGSAALLARAEALFGPVAQLPAKLYPRADRAAVLASFAPEVARCAAHDAPAAAILREAARHVADAAAAVCPAEGPTAVALTGGLLRVGEPLLAPLRAALAERLPHARHVKAAGDPLNGALRIAAALAGGSLALPSDEQLLQISGPVRPSGRIVDEDARDKTGRIPPDRTLPRHPGRSRH
ncbi:BadF/BadG/BcrA/BcrD ATPase family protein [Streptomyces sp. NPDC003077]|uniref:BadF/BadG/BcrA/BcrD ATPase family protein n=1 Tax=Streptomyces sp. NPDC003077 TaxID=3154443 RepID=UPI0033B48680